MAGVNKCNPRHLRPVIVGAWPNRKGSESWKMVPCLGQPAGLRSYWLC